MRALSFVCLLLTLALAGCGISPGTSTGSPIIAAQNVTGNWQIQSGSSSSPMAGVLLLGDLVSSGANVSGTFRFIDLAQGNGCGAITQVITVSGSVDPTNPVAQVLKLTSAPFSGSVVTVQLTLPALLQGFGAGTIQVAGPTCTFASSAAIGALFLPTNGTYSGTLSPASGSPGTAGSASLTLAQATSPSADGQYAVTGSIQFSNASCNVATALTGSASGIAITADASLTQATVVHVLATQLTPGMTQNLSTTLFLYSSTCPSASGLAQYTGTLVKQ